MTSSYRSTLIGLGITVLVAAGAIGTLLATGVVVIGHNEGGDSDAREDEDPDEADAEGAKDGKRRKKRGKGKGKGKGKGGADQLASLGYVDGVVDTEIDRSGVTVHDRSRAWQGINFYSSRSQSRAQLMDMDGKVLHSWEVEGGGSWHSATLLPSGDILALVKDKKVIRLDASSNVKWTYEGRVHHDLWVDVDETVHVLSARTEQNPRYDAKEPTIEDLIVVLSPDGEVIEDRELSVLRIIEESPYAMVLNDTDSLTAKKVRRANPRKNIEFDILHTNHVEVFDGKLADKGEIFAKGNILFSPRNAHVAMIYNPTSKKIVWAWGTSALVFPHHPTLTSEGTMLVFNNGTEETGSQVVEVDPLTNDIVWTYGPTEGFYSETRGSNQRLPNGNTLITESDTGYVFEVDRGGDVVWEFRNPHTKKKEGLRMAIWRMTRYAKEELKFAFNRG